MDEKILKTENIDMGKDVNDEEIIFGNGIDEEFTTDGKLHEEEFLNKVFMYTDTEDSFKIEKDETGYIITDYTVTDSENKEGSDIEEEISKLEVYDNKYFVAKNGLIYAYDTKLEKVVFLNRNNNFRIIKIAEEAE